MYSEILILILLPISYFQIYQTYPVIETSANNITITEKNAKLFGGDMAGVNIIEYSERKAVPKASQLWPNGIIYYMIDASVANKLTILKQAMEHIMSKTCIRFEPRVSQTDYIVIYSGTGCYSTVGREGGQQTVSLGVRCDTFKTAVHELMHAIGFYHEHNRSDRDQYITVFLENVAEQDWDNFVLLKDSQNLLLTEFDFDSVMLYGNTSFSKNGNLTMVSKVAGKTVHDFEPTKGLSAMDSYSINKLYACK